MKTIIGNKKTTTLIILGMLVLSVGAGFLIPQLLHSVQQLEEESRYQSPEENQHDAEFRRTDETDPKETVQGLHVLSAAEKSAVSGHGSGAQDPDEAVDDGPDSPGVIAPEESGDPELRHRDRLWMEQKIREMEAQVDPADLEDFRRIMGKLDLGRVEQITGDGLTEQSQDALRAYLRTQLTSPEYERAKVLFATYLHLLVD